MHASTHWHASFRLYVDVDERLHEVRSRLFERRLSLYVGVGVRYAVLQRLNLSVHAHLRCWQSGYAHFHFYEFHAGLFLGERRHLLHLADCGLGEVLNAELAYQSVYQLFVYRSLSHVCVC